MSHKYAASFCSSGIQLFHISQYRLAPVGIAQNAGSCQIDLGVKKLCEFLIQPGNLASEGA